MELNNGFSHNNSLYTIPTTLLFLVSLSLFFGKVEFQTKRYIGKFLKLIEHMKIYSDIVARVV